jgi:hypothetical protein
VKAAGEPKPVKAKKGKAEKTPEPETTEEIDIEASLEPTAE